MGIIDRRLEDLEEIDRQRATAEVRRAWDRLSDEELALVLAPYCLGREPTPEERAAEASLSATVSEDLVARAIGYREDLSEEEISLRFGELLDPILGPRRVRVRPLILEIGEA